MKLLLPLLADIGKSIFIATLAGLGCIALGAWLWGLA